MKPLVYIAGPYANPDPIVNTYNAIKVGLELNDSGLCVTLIPHLTLLAHMVSPRDDEYWYAFDLDQLAHCDALLRIPGVSTGADREVEFAEGVGIPVFRDKRFLLRALVERAFG